MDATVFIYENYFTFLLLGGLLIVMLAYRDVRLPATRNFLFIILVLLLMSGSSSLERWAVFSPDRESIRVLASVIHYILQPLVIYLELVIIMPRGGTQDRLKQLLLTIPLILNTIIYLIAPLTGTLVFCYDEDYCFNRGPLGYSIYIVTFFYLTLLLLWSIRSFQNNDKRQSIILFFIAGAALLTGLLEGLNVITGYIDEAFALGIFLYYVYLATVHEAALQASMAQQQVRLSQSKVELLRRQIQPHFIFNSLQAIKALIRKDPAKAGLVLEDFSGYLRANLEVMTSDRLIPFEDELEHVKEYVSLVLADETKDINVQYDIETEDFLLPPLTIQPLVENALQHGVKDGGTVRLTTRAEGDAALITISDNGCGFPSCQNRSMERVDTYSAGAKSGAGFTGVRNESGFINAGNESDSSGIGIENVRLRLASLCEGTLDIKSGSCGTVVTIRIPWQEKD